MRCYALEGPCLQFLLVQKLDLPHQILLSLLSVQGIIVFLINVAGPALRRVLVSHLRWRALLARKSEAEGLGQLCATAWHVNGVEHGGSQFVLLESVGSLDRGALVVQDGLLGEFGGLQLVRGAERRG